MLRGAWFASALFSLWLPGHARGELVTFKFTGTVTSVSVDPRLQSYDFPDVGDPFTGYYRFDSAAQDTDESPDEGNFSTVLPYIAVAVSIGEFEFQGRSTSISTYPGLYSVGDHLPKIELTSNLELAQILNRNHFNLVIDKDNLILDPNMLPLSPPSLDGAQSYLRMVMDRSPNPGAPFVFIDATLDSLTAVPEPSSLLLLTIASTWLLRFRRRR
jgi:hypothetical protein